jgi:hypothetical protein
MGVQSTDLMLVERAGTPYKTTAGAVAGLGGGGGGFNSVSAQVDFGAGDGYVEAVVAAPWATPTTHFIISPALPTTVDHDAADALLEGLSGAVVAVEEGVGFTLGVSAPFESWGRYDFTCMGI